MTARRRWLSLSGLRLAGATVGCHSGGWQAADRGWRRAGTRSHPCKPVALATYTKLVGFGIHRRARPSAPGRAAARPRWTPPRRASKWPPGADGICRHPQAPGRDAPQVARRLSTALAWMFAAVGAHSSTVSGRDALCYPHPGACCARSDPQDLRASLRVLACELRWQPCRFSCPVRFSYAPLTASLGT
jgi:hypothetical protein